MPIKKAAKKTPVKHTGKHGKPVLIWEVTLGRLKVQAAEKSAKLGRPVTMGQHIDDLSLGK